MLTRVMNLETGEIAEYSLPPDEAVICAYAQFTRKDNNTFGYWKYEELLDYGHYTVTCGSWCALTKKGVRLVKRARTMSKIESMEL